MFEIIALVVYFASAFTTITIFAIYFCEARAYIKEQLLFKPHRSMKEFSLTWFDWVILIILSFIPVLNVVFTLSIISEIDELKEAIFDEIDRRLEEKNF